MKVSMHRGVVMVLWVAILAACAVSTTGPAAAQSPDVKIKIIKNQGKPNCTAAGNCALLVKDNRGLGVCKSKKQDNGNTFCWDDFSWTVNAGASHLTSDHKVVIRWSPMSTRGSDTCLNATEYELNEANGWTATATVQNVATCFAKSAWFYDVILDYNGTEIDKKDPGVIIDN